MALSGGNFITTLQRTSTSNRVARRRTRRSVEIEVAGQLRKTAPWRLSHRSLARLRDSVPLVNHARQWQSGLVAALK